MIESSLIIMQVTYLNLGFVMESINDLVQIFMEIRTPIWKIEVSDGIKITFWGFVLQ